jgi:asparagine synthetase B (glutamine-hydrolysing)
MFQFFIKANRSDAERFSALLDRHARWLGMQLAVENATLPDGRRLDRYRLAVEAAAPTATATGAIRFHADAESGELIVDVPAVTPEQAYYTAVGDSFIVGDDLRPLWIWAGAGWDTVGAASQMQFGMVPAPNTVAAGVQRIPGGYRLRHRDARRGAELSLAVKPPQGWMTTVADDEVDRLTLERFDANLESLPERPVVFFSGGTDSGLIAARLAKLGRSDTQLVNYAFGEDDPESGYAERLARSMGLGFTRITHRESSVLELVDRVGRDAAFPYNDLSSIPTHQMIHDAEGLLPAGGAALLGVGADDVYDGGLKIHSWERVARKPRWARRLIVELLGISRPWWRDDSSRRLWGILRRSLTFEADYAGAIMHNDLAGIAYPIRSSQAEIVRCWERSYSPFVGTLSSADRLAWVYLVNGGMGWEAPKFEPLRNLGVQAHYPFLDGSMLEHGFSLSWKQKCGETKEKILLKRLLEESLPEGVQESRAKVGFSPPFAKLLTDREVQARMRSLLLDQDAPVTNAYHRRFVQEALDRGARGERPNRGLINVIWSAFFWAAWAKQVREALTEAP